MSDPTRPQLPWLRRHGWGLLACTWSAIYLLVIIAWNLGLPGYPYGVHLDPGRKPMSLLDSVPPSIGGPALAAGAALGLPAALWLTVAHRAGPVARVATGIAIALCAAMIMVGDYRPLLAIARTPVYLVLKTFLGIPADLGYLEFVRAMYGLPVWHQFWQQAGIVILLLALREFWRRVSDGCPVCGRPEAMSWWSTRRGARTWGLFATIVAVGCPLPYASTRYLLALGIPADGFTKEHVDRMAAELPGVWVAGAALATLGVLGAVLTLGLVQRWGERWPFWVPVLRGRPINPRVAIIPAGLVSLLLPGSALMMLRIHIHRYRQGELELGQVILAPMNAWLIWGFALAAAALAYWLRRRPDCPTCHRGQQPTHGIWIPPGDRDH